MLIYLYALSIVLQNHYDGVLISLLPGRTPPSGREPAAPRRGGAPAAWDKGHCLCSSPLWNLSLCYKSPIVNLSALANPERTPCRPSAQSCKPCANLVHTPCEPRADPVHTPCEPHAPLSTDVVTEWQHTIWCRHFVFSDLFLTGQSHVKSDSWFDFLSSKRVDTYSNLIPLGTK